MGERIPSFGFRSFQISCSSFSYPVCPFFLMEPMCSTFFCKVKILKKVKFFARQVLHVRMNTMDRLKRLLFFCLRLQLRVIFRK